MLRNLHKLSRVQNSRFSSAAPAPKTNPEILYTGLFINNEWVKSSDGKTFPTENPATGKVIADVQQAGTADVAKAVRAAKDAFKCLMSSTHTLLFEGQTSDELFFVLYSGVCGQIIPWNFPLLMAAWKLGPALASGCTVVMKPAEQTPLTALYIAQLVKVCASRGAWKLGPALASGCTVDMKPAEQTPLTALYIAQLVKGCVEAGPALASGCTVVMKPAEQKPLMAFYIAQLVKVCASRGAWKLGPALASGCTVVMKPAEQTPLTALYIAQLVKVCASRGAWKLGAALASGCTVVMKPAEQTPLTALYIAQLVKVCASRGSTEVGKLIQRNAAGTVKRITLELGGKSPNIILGDVDLEQAVEAAHTALFYNMGQCCTAGSRTFVEDKIYDKFVELSAERAKKRVVGDPFRPDVESGPQIDAEQHGKILGLINRGKEQGAKLVAGGGRHGDTGYFVQPTVFSDVHDNMDIAKQELDEVVERANDTVYGLAAAVFTKDLDKANYLVQIPFGGFKQSGVGRENGPYGINNYTEVKAVVIKLTDKNS
ncbi:Mitochondrial aldehyde dehydrogenase [Operophtera brumata]|uniref:Mitochondrial aldehyde dehydrogenase n=1 Tax=Operophtera brumata TaxID=104452 RepID=A0A0L7KXD5_OPEBR|nr:Mitochondrial aldehyde dehydrogenase [Operophtera brumata]